MPITVRDLMDIVGDIPIDRVRLNRRMDISGVSTLGELIDKAEGRKKRKPSGLYRCLKCGNTFYSYAGRPDCRKCRTTRISIVEAMPVSQVKAIQTNKKVPPRDAMGRFKTR